MPSCSVPALGPVASRCESATVTALLPGGSAALPVLLFRTSAKVTLLPGWSAPLPELLFRAATATGWRGPATGSASAESWNESAKVTDLPPGWDAAPLLLRAGF